MGKITNPISTNQIIDVGIPKPECFDINCNDLNSWLGEISNKLCTHDGFLDIDNYDLDCFANPKPTDFKELVQKIVDTTFCGDGSSGGSGGSGTTTIADNTSININYCITDTWRCGEDNICLQVDECNSPVPEPTLEQILQAMVKRMNSYAVVINLLCDRVSTLETTVSDLQNQINTFECC